MVSGQQRCMGGVVNDGIVEKSMFRRTIHPIVKTQPLSPFISTRPNNMSKRTYLTPLPFFPLLQYTVCLPPIGSEIQYHCSYRQCIESTHR
jgi:hypothetical protein